MPRHRSRRPAPTDEHSGHGRTPAPRADGATIAPQITISGHTVLWCPDGRSAATLRRAVAALAHALADDHGITQALLTEAERMPRDILGNRDYLPSVAARAWRWVAEMHEVADTLRAQYLPSDLALATAEILRRWADTTTADQPTDLADILRQLHAGT